MTKTFTYRFTTYETVLGALTTKDHELKVTVTDRMEERNGWKRAYAANKINDVLRTEYGYKRAIQGWELKEEQLKEEHEKVQQVLHTASRKPM